MNTLPLKRVVRINERALPETTDPTFSFRYIDIGTVGRGELTSEPTEISFAVAPSRARRLVRNGDTIISTVRTYLRAVLPIRGPSDDLVVSTGFAVLTPGPMIDNRYLGWLTQSDAVVEQVVARSVGVSYPAINASEIGDLRVGVPPLPYQRAIADYLDVETACIDALIEAEKSRLNLARERLSSGVQALVLGRSHDEVRINDPLGPAQLVPLNWALRRNKTFLREIADLSGSGAEELLTVSHLTGVTPRSEKDVTMFLAESNSGYKRVEKHDLVINTMWAWMGALGVSRYEGIVSPAYGVYRFTDSAVEPGYFDALFRSPAYVTEMTRYSKGVWTSRLRLYPESFLALATPFPPVEEQRAIAALAQRMTIETEKICELLQRSIDLLAERRQALITAAVTGQLDIPELAA